jgi:hypothetical protein
MSAQNFWSRFRKQFSNEEWIKLNENSEFRKALDAKDDVKAGLLADQILIGDAKTKKQAKQIKKEHVVWSDYRTLFTDKKWAKLNESPEFRKAWDAKDEFEMFRLAEQILLGNDNKKTSDAQLVEFLGYKQ